jgi:hypothetical protein
MPPDPNAAIKYRAIGIELDRNREKKKHRAEQQEPD